jgi:hypothetical protein
MSLPAKEVSRDTEHFVIGNRLLAAHAAQYTADANPVLTPPRTGRRTARRPKNARWPLDI